MNLSNIFRTIVFFLIMFIIFSLIWIPLNILLGYCIESLITAQEGLNVWWFVIIFLALGIGFTFIHSLFQILATLLGTLFRFTLRIAPSENITAIIILGVGGLTCLWNVICIWRFADHFSVFIVIGLIYASAVVIDFYLQFISAITKQKTVSYE